MTLNERYRDVSERTGLSEEIIRRVLSGFADSGKDSLRHGEAVTVPGLSTLTPELREKTVIENGVMLTRQYIKVKIKPTHSLATEMDMCDRFEEREETEEIDYGSNIRIGQIAALM